MAQLRHEPGPHQHSVLITAEGDLDIRTSREFDEYLTAAGADHRYLIIDLSAVTFLDSSALAVIVHQWKKLSAADGSLALVRARKQTSRVFWISGMAARLALYDTVAEAATALAARPQRGTTVPSATVRPE